MSDISTDKSRWTPWCRWGFEYIEQELAGVHDNTVILDLGAGEKQVRKLLKKGKYITADFRAYEGVDVVTDLTKELPFECNSVDYIILSNVLEQIPPDLVVKFQAVDIAEAI
jgi:Hypothetical methyltransferase